MLKREEEQRHAVEMLCTDMVVPKDHLLRKIDKAVDFKYIYTLVEDLYSPDNGRPSVDPVVLFKIVLIQHLFGIRSLRQAVREIELNIGYRWFLGYTLCEPIPHFATVSYAFRQRFGSDIVEQVFQWILTAAQQRGCLSPEAVFIDATHVKANANLQKKIKQAIPQAAKQYEQQLRDEVNQDREAHGMKPFDDPPEGTPPQTREVTVSKTDPESGLFHKGEHRKCFAYGVHTACEKHNFILGVEVTAGNLHDSTVFDSLYKEITQRFPQAKAIVADAGYKTPWICKQVLDDGRLPVLPYKRPMTPPGYFPPYDYVYDEYYDCVLCPQNRVLAYATTNREGRREFKSHPHDCRACPVRERCTRSKTAQKTVQRHLWEAYIDHCEDIRHSDAGKALYPLRSETIERVFADAKEKHAMRYTYYRGLDQVTKWVKLKFAAMNLKKLAMWRGRPSFQRCFLHLIKLLRSYFFRFIPKNPRSCFVTRVL